MAAYPPADFQLQDVPGIPGRGGGIGPGRVDDRLALGIEGDAGPQPDPAGNDGLARVDILQRPSAAVWSLDLLDEGMRERRMGFSHAAAAPTMVW
jgi:hypothetical protein